MNERLRNEAVTPLTVVIHWAICLIDFFASFRFSLGVQVMERVGSWGKRKNQVWFAGRRDEVKCIVSQSVLKGFLWTVLRFRSLATFILTSIPFHSLLPPPLTWTCHFSVKFHPMLKPSSFDGNKWNLSLKYPLHLRRNQNEHENVLYRKISYSNGQSVSRSKSTRTKAEEKMVFIYLSLWSSNIATSV